jgi:hypothetical protein
MAGTLLTMILGYLANIFGAADNPIVFGQLLMVIQSVAFLGMIPLFGLAGKAYEKEIK